MTPYISYMDMAPPAQAAEPGMFVYGWFSPSMTWGGGPVGIYRWMGDNEFIHTFPLPSNDGDIADMLVDSNGDVWACGAFVSAGGNNANNVCKWDPNTSSWQGVGYGVNGQVFSLEEIDGKVWITGFFNAAYADNAGTLGNSLIHSRAMWNGFAWEDPLPALGVTYGICREMMVVSGPSATNELWFSQADSNSRWVRFWQDGSPPWGSIDADSLHGELVNTQNVPGGFIGRSVKNLPNGNILALVVSSPLDVQILEAFWMINSYSWVGFTTSNTTTQGVHGGTIEVDGSDYWAIIHGRYGYHIHTNQTQAAYYPYPAGNPIGTDRRLQQQHKIYYKDMGQGKKFYLPTSSTAGNWTVISLDPAELMTHSAFPTETLEVTTQGTSGTRCSATWFDDFNALNI